MISKGCNLSQDANVSLAFYDDFIFIFEVLKKTKGTLTAKAVGNVRPWLQVAMHCYRRW